MAIPEGCIMRMSLKDFMTFDDVTFRPGNKLNLVIGPNGSGKSSLSCAMVLGLAGKTKILGRAPEVGQFVKRGKRIAEVEIELYRKNDDNIVVKRTMTIDNKTTWHLNKEPANQKQVEALMKSLQIQVDNLCQFLPQDRVHDFAKMNKQELLDNTQKSVGSPRLYEMFNELKSNMKLDGGHEKDIQKLKDQLLKAEDSASRLETEIQKVKRRKKIIEEVANLKRKKAFLTFETKKERLDFMTKLKDEKTRIYKKKEKDLEPFTKNVEKAEKRFSICENQMGRLKLNAQTDYDGSRQHLQAVHDLHAKISDIKVKLKRTIEDDSRAVLEMRSVQDEIDRIENSISSAKNEEINSRLMEVEQKFSEASEEHLSISNEHEDKKHKLENIKNSLRVVNNRIELANNVQTKKLSLLETKDRDAYKVRQFYQENKHLFSGEVYGPIFTELNVAENFAKYVEDSLPFSEKISFICEKASDVTKLIQHCRTKLNLKFNVFAAPPNQGPVREVYKPRIPISELRNLGFSNYILDFLEGPEVVLRYLCHSFKLHNIPVGSELVMETRNAQRIEALGLNRYFSDKQSIRISRSRYSNATRRKAAAIKSPTLFIYHAKADSTLQTKAEELEQQVEKHQQILNEVNERKVKIQAKVNNLFNDRKTLQVTQESLKKMIEKKQFLHRQLKRLERNRIDKEFEERKAADEMRKTFDQCVNRLVNVVENSEKYQEKLIKNALLGAKSKILLDDIASKKEAWNAASHELNTIKTEIADYEQKCSVLKKEADDARKDVLALTDNVPPDSDEFKKKYSKKFSELPENYDEILQLIVNYQARADCLDSNEQAILEHEQLKKDIERLQKEIAGKNEAMAALKLQTQNTKTKWLSELKQLVSTINKCFSKVFQRMGCAGEVSLTNSGNEEDVMKFGLTIKVKFREEDELQELDIFRQSGGERAVTIAIYMLSLQELTHVPFRCLDEINQGMDEQNERRVFNTLVETVKKNSGSQYFLLTPKLLQGLKYTKEVQVHVIMNGRGAVTDSQWFKVNQMIDKIGMKRKHQSDSESD